MMTPEETYKCMHVLLWMWLTPGL